MRITLDRLNEIAAELTVEYTSDLLVTGTAPALIEHLALSPWAELQAESAFGNSPRSLLIELRGPVRRRA